MNPTYTVCSLAMAFTLVACGGGSGDTPPNDSEPPPAIGAPPENDGDLPRIDVRDVDQLVPYRQASSVSEVLKQCALVDDIDNICSLSTLPYIAQGNPQFSKADILDRVLITHQWMGERFEALLNDAPEDLLRLFGSVTSISIGSTVRPSIYSSALGAIRLDPYNLWLSVEEKANISTQDDPRSDYGRDLQFLTLQSYRKNGQPAYASFNLTDYKERTFADIRIPVQRLLFHELAHAVDYISAASIASIGFEQTPLQAVNTLADQRVSTMLYNDLPLYSDAMFGLAQVRYKGAQATDEQKAMTSYDVGAEMAIDGAAKFYGYSTIREDMATLFATTMIKKHHNVDVAMGFAQKPENLESYVCEDLLVGWGVRNRLADPLVVPRAKRVIDTVYGPNASNDQFFSSDLGVQSLMTPGVDWCTNRDQGATAASYNDSLNSHRRAAQADSEFQQLQFELFRPTH